MTWSTEDLEALLDDASLDESELHQRIGDDQEALQELAWLRAERGLMDARSTAEQPPADALWSKIEARITSPAPSVSTQDKPDSTSTGLGWLLSKWAQHRLALTGLTMAAAATALLVHLSAKGPTQLAQQAPTQLVSEVQQDAAAKPDTEHPFEPSDKADRAMQAVQEAELAYSSALDLLEDAYQEQRPSLPAETIARIDEEFRETRSLLHRTQDPDFNGLSERRRLMLAYSSRIRSLQSTVISLEVSP